MEVRLKRAACEVALLDSFRPYFVLQGTADGLGNGNDAVLGIRGINRRFRCWVA
jgi:hypothetical protein